jgi:hypothetical protein
MGTNYAVNAYKGKGTSHAQNTARRVVIKPDLMNKYHFRSSSQTANNQIQGVLYVNKAFAANAGIVSTDTLTITIVDGT